MMSAAALPSVFELALTKMDTPDTPLETAIRCFPDVIDEILADRLRIKGVSDEPRLIRRVELMVDAYLEMVVALNGPLRCTGRPANSFAVIALRHAAYRFFKSKRLPHLEALDSAVKLLGGRPYGTRSSVQKAVRQWRELAPLAFQIPCEIRPAFAHLPVRFAREYSYVLYATELLLICREDHERMKREKMPDRHGGRRNPLPV